MALGVVLMTLQVCVLENEWATSGVTVAASVISAPECWVQTSQTTGNPGAEKVTLPHID